ncbi:MAG: glycosyltransferase family 39 protein [Candidatus Eremiobacteraeota bacterium]|nr:glycosyltransferase family 39 protein [Candidatus Eremiobacteraeota bacterium]
MEKDGKKKNRQVLPEKNNIDSNNAQADPHSGTLPDVDELKENQKKQNILKKLSDNWHIIFLILLILVFTLNNYHFIANDRSPLPSDSGVMHLLRTLKTYSSIENMKMTGLLRFDYPPLVYIVTYILIKIFGLSIETALWSIYPFSVLLIIMFFAVGNHFGGKTGGVACALIGTANCNFINYSHLYMLDVPHAAIVALMFYFLLKSKAFEKPVYSYLFGVAMGLSFLTRFTSTLFIAGPLLVLVIYLAVQGIREFLLTILAGGCLGGMLFYLLSLSRENMHHSQHENIFLGKSLIVLFIVCIILFIITFVIGKFLLNKIDEKKKKNIGKILLGTRAIIIGILLAMPYYLYAAAPLMGRFLGHHKRHEIFTMAILKGRLIRNIYYIHNFFPFILILVIIGLVFFLVRRKKALDFIMLITMGITGLIFTSFIAFEFNRYLMGEILVLAVLGGYWVEYAGKLKFPALAFVFAYSMLTICFPFYSPDVPMRDDEAYIVGIRKKKFFYLDSYYPTNPVPDRMKLYMITEDIEKKYNESIKGNYPNFDIYFYYSDKFAPQKNYFIIDSYRIVLEQILRFAKMPIPEGGFIDLSPPRDYVKKHKKLPFYMILGYVDSAYPKRIVEMIQSEHQRKVEMVASYCTDGVSRKKINLYVVYPPLVEKNE